MAFYKLDVKVFSRGKGGCVTRAAAYRAGERIRDERTSHVHDWAFREDVVHKEILLPSQFAGNAAMDWARDRATLWNCVERTDSPIARLGRDVMVVLPAELTAAQRVQLARRYGQELAERYLAVVDVAVHLPRPTSNEFNHHAHLLMTARQVTPEGIGSRTILEMAGKELHALGLGSSKNELLLMRERWAQVTNEALCDAGQIESAKGTRFCPRHMYVGVPSQGERWNRAIIAVIIGTRKDIDMSQRVSARVSPTQARDSRLNSREILPISFRRR
jgi:hypothetical protein